VFSEWQLEGQCPQTGYAHDGDMEGVTEPFGQRKTHPEAGKAAGSCGHGNTFDIPGFNLGPGEQRVDGRHQTAEMPFSLEHQLFCDNRTVFTEQRHAALPGRGIQCQDHGCKSFIAGFS
jgi:hypothetical protein